MEEKVFLRDSCSPSHVLPGSRSPGNIPLGSCSCSQVGSCPIPLLRVLVFSSRLVTLLRENLLEHASALG
ncbi:neuroligin-1, partial [Clarias magur]